MDLCSLASNLRIQFVNLWGCLWAARASTLRLKIFSMLFLDLVDCYALTGTHNQTSILLLFNGFWSGLLAGTVANGTRFDTTTFIMFAPTILQRRLRTWIYRAPFIYILKWSLIIIWYRCSFLSWIISFVGFRIQFSPFKRCLIILATLSVRNLLVGSRFLTLSNTNILLWSRIVCIFIGWLRLLLPLESFRFINRYWTFLAQFNFVVIIPPRRTLRVWSGI